MDLPIEGRTKSALMLMLAAGVLYAASRAIVFALARPDGSDPGRRAIGQGAPIFATVIAAILMGRADVAVAIIFATSVALLSLVLGMTTYIAPMNVLPPSRRVWPFILPAALLTMMAGFSAHLTWWHALMLLVLGSAILAVWLAAPDATEELPPRPMDSSFAALLVIGMVPLLVLGAWLAIHGTLLSSQNSSRMLTPATLAATILSPLLVLPTLGTASAVAQRGHPSRALTALVGTVLLNLCLFLPIAILLWYPASDGWHLASFKEFRAPWESTHALPFAMATWRIENVILVVLGFGLVPVSMGRWAVGRFESTLLIAGYAAYIVALAVFGLQLS